jgi:hypothetical protein
MFIQTSLVHFFAFRPTSSCCRGGETCMANPETDVTHFLARRQKAGFSQRWRTMRWPELPGIWQRPFTPARFS